MSTQADIWNRLKAGAITFSRGHGGEKIKDPAPGNIEGLRNTLADAVTNEWDAIELAKEIAARFSYPASRALMIARTELRTAFIHSSLELAKSVEARSLPVLNAAGARARELWYPAQLRESRAARRQTKG